MNKAARLEREAKGKAAFAKNAEIRDKQAKMMAEMKQDALYVTLYHRPNVKNEPNFEPFHWSLYHQHPEGQYSGTRYHITGSTGTWRTEHHELRNPFVSLVLVVVIKIGSLPHDDLTGAIGIIKSLDESLNDTKLHPEMNCHFWVCKIVEKLAEAGYLACPNVKAFEQECRQFGAQHLGGALNNAQPRPLVVSTTCS